MEIELLTLIPILQEAFNWNLSRAKCASSVIIGFIKTRTVNLVQLATSLSGKAKKESKYRRIQRLMSELNINMNSVAIFIAKQFPNTKFTLIMDRTNWKLGKTFINILFIAIYYKGFAIPILWTTFPQYKKSGNSNTKERINLVNTFIEIFGIKSIECIIADREFLGKKWLNYLIKKHIEFRIRIRSNIKIYRSKKRCSLAKNLFNKLSCGEGMQLSGKRIVFGISLYVTGMKLQTGELLIIVSNDSASCKKNFE